jgi:hypothetical protein
LLETFTFIRFAHVDPHQFPEHDPQVPVLKSHCPVQQCSGHAFIVSFIARKSINNIPLSHVGPHQFPEHDPQVPVLKSHCPVQQCAGHAFFFFVSVVVFINNNIPLSQVGPHQGPEHDPHIPIIVNNCWMYEIGYLRNYKNLQSSEVGKLGVSHWLCY